jgi:hypothetical protein
MKIKRGLFCVIVAGACCGQAPQPAARAAKPTSSAAGPSAPAPPKKSGSIDGTAVSSSSIAPVKKATVALRNTQQNFSYVAVSDTSGHFQFPSVEPGTYTIGNVSAPGYVYQPPAGRSAISRITVGEDQHINDLKVLLLPLGAISGKIIDDDGDPLAGATVQALHYMYSAGTRRLVGAGNATSDDRGEYRLFDLQPGHYFLRVSQRNPAFLAPVNAHSDIQELGYESIYYPGVGDLSQALRVESTPGGEMIAVDFRLRKVPTYHIRGQITNPPRQGNIPLRVQPCQSQLEFDPTAQNVASIQQDGKFDARGLQPGVYCLITDQNAAQGRNFGHAAATVTVTNRNVDDLQLTLAPVGDVSGSVQADTQLKSPFTTINILFQGTTSADRSVSARVAADGTFKLMGVAPGAHQITVTGVPPDVYLRSLEYDRQDVSNGSVEISQSGGTLTLRLGTDTGRLNLTVQTDKGDAATGTLVVLVPDGRLASRRDLLRTIMTDPTGRSQVSNLAPGDYKIYAIEDTDLNIAQSVDFQKEIGSKALPITIHSNGLDSADLKLVPAEEIQQIKNKLQ